MTPPVALRQHLSEIDRQIARAIEHVRGLYALESAVLAALGARAGAVAPITNPQPCELAQVA